MDIALTLFLGIFFQLVSMYVVMVVLWMLLRLVGWPIRWFVDSISGLHG